MALLASTPLTYPLVVLDLEWNQRYGKQGSLQDPLPQEIFEIGAVKLDTNLCIVDQFRCTVRPTVHPVLQRHVRRLTGIDPHEWLHGQPFLDACHDLMAFCGPAFTLLTWGPDDYPVLQKNLAYWKLPMQWLPLPLDAQLVYAHLLLSNVQQVALSTALLALGIEPDMAPHRALHDAYYTARVWQHLHRLATDMRADDPRITSLHRALDDHALRFTARSAQQTTPHRTLGAVLADKALLQPRCPLCDEVLTDCSPRITANNPQRFEVLGCCAQHQAALTRYTLEADAAGLLHLHTRAVLVSDHQARAILARQAKQLARQRQKPKARAAKPTPKATQPRTPAPAKEALAPAQAHPFL